MRWQNKWSCFFALAFLFNSFAFAVENNESQEPELIGPAQNKVLSEEDNEQFLQEKSDADRKDEEREFYFNDFLKISGGLEVEIASRKAFDETQRHLDFDLSTAELIFELTNVDWVQGVISIESEDVKEKRFGLKEGYLVFGDTDDFPTFLKTGRFFVPFGLGDGAFLGDTLSISDPLTIEIFETRVTGALFGTKWNGWDAGIYAFRDENIEDPQDQMGATLGYTIAKDSFSISFGLDYLTSVFSSEGLSEAFPDDTIQETAPGFAAHVSVFVHGISFLAEYDSALNHGTVSEDAEIVKITPKAWMAELGYTQEVYSRPTYVALDYSQSENLEGRFAKTRVLGTVGRWVDDQFLIALEYGHDKDYSKSEGGTGRSRNSVILQVATEFG